MKIKYLHYFIEIVKHQGFTQASQKIYLSQSTLSKAIKTLEEQLNVLLIDRTSKKFKLTREGQLFYDNTVNALKTIESELNKLKDNASFAKGRITVGIPPMLCTTHFTSSITEFQTLYPDIQLDIKEYTTRIIQEKIEKNELDAGVIMLPIQSEDLYITNFIESDLVCVVNNKHKLANKSNISIQEIKDEKFIILDESYMLHDKIKDIFHKYNLTPNIIRTSSQWDLIVEMASLNLGVAFLPQIILQKFQFENIKTLPLIEPEFHIVSAFIVKKNKYISLAIDIFIDFFVNKLR